RDNFGRNGLDVGRVRQLRVRHDRRRIGIDENDPVALGLQSLAGLGPRIIELAGLADDDRPGPDDQDGFDIRAFRHEAALYCRSGGLAIARLRFVQHVRRSPRAGTRPASWASGSGEAPYFASSLGGSTLISTG